MEAMLVAAGQHGFRQVSVKNVLELYGGHRVQFWQHFASKEECFAAACASWDDRLVAELLTAAADRPEWGERLRAAVIALFEFVDSNPEIARSLLIEAEIAGGEALAKREEAVDRLGAAIDLAREQAAPGEQPPPLTGLFVAGGIAGYVGEQIAAGTAAAIWEGMPELMRFATAPYLGEEGAEAEFEAAAAFVERRARGEEKQ